MGKCNATPVRVSSGPLEPVKDNSDLSMVGFE
jgi:hypothetical protein